MEEVIKENANLVSQIFSHLNISRQVLEDLSIINNLEDNINSKNLNKPINSHNWKYSIEFQNKVKSESEFRKYLEKNNITGYKTIDKEEMMAEDYSIIMPSGIRADFYNPGIIL